MVRRNKRRNKNSKKMKGNERKEGKKDNRGKDAKTMRIKKEGKKE